MKRNKISFSLITIVLLLSLLLTSCSSKKAEIISDVDSLTYNGVKYNYIGYYDAIDNFTPYAYFDENPVVINGKYTDGEKSTWTVSEKDINKNFICSPNELLNSLFYLKESVKIPEKLPHSNYIDAIRFSTDGNKYSHITNNDAVVKFTDYINSLTDTDFGDNYYNAGVQPYNQMYFGSSFYGGEFTTEYSYSFSDEALYISTYSILKGTRKIEAPKEISSIFFDETIICKSIKYNSTLYYDEEIEDAFNAAKKYLRKLIPLSKINRIKFSGDDACKQELYLSRDPNETRVVKDCIVVTINFKTTFLLDESVMSRFEDYEWNFTLGREENGEWIVWNHGVY